MLRRVAGRHVEVQTTVFPGMCRDAQCGLSLCGYGRGSREFKQRSVLSATTHKQRWVLNTVGDFFIQGQSEKTAPSSWFMTDSCPFSTVVS
jgi:hypothetical protein